MKKVIGVVVVLLLAITLLPACGQGGETPGGQSPGGETPDGETPGGKVSGDYTGVMQFATGQWAEWVSSGNGKETHMKMEVVGKETVDGKTCIGFEMDMDEGVMQIWVDAVTNQPVKYVMKAEGQVICMPLAQATEIPQTDTAKRYPPTHPNISYGTYKVPASGKEIKVAIFKNDDKSQAWVSSEVPFGMVKAIDPSGGVGMYLYNFGTSGANRDISKAEMDSCIQMPTG